MGVVGGGEQGGGSKGVGKLQPLHFNFFFISVPDNCSRTVD